MAIPLVDVAWQHRQVRSELDRAYDQLLTDVVCDGVGFCLELEAQFTAYFGFELHAITVQSGLAAEFLALKALGIGPGDEVITVPNSDMATTAAITHTGARFVLVDVDTRTHNLDPTQIEEAITPSTKAIVPVHMFGLPAEMDAICTIAQKHGLFVVEDATLGLGATYKGRKAGTLADAAFFSFAPRKVIGGIGNGGLVLTRDRELAYRISLLKGYGLEPERGERPIAERHLDGSADAVVEGHNLKMDALQAAVVSAKFAHLDEWAKLRQAVARRYDQAFSDLDTVSPPFVPSHAGHSRRNYVVTVPASSRRAIRSALQEKGITTSVLYTPPVHLQTVYLRLGLGAGAFPVAEKLAKQLLCLPIYPGMTVGQVDEITSSVFQALGSTRCDT